MADHNCDNCGFRAKYDRNPKSFLGRLWRWHANWCPGWKKYKRASSEGERKLLAQKYNMPKYR